MRTPGILYRLFPFWLYVFLFKFGAGLHYALLPSLGERILPIWVVGLLIGGVSLLQLIFDVPAGFTLDRFGYIRVMRLSTFLFLIGALFLVFGLSLFTYLATLFLGFIGWLFYGPGNNAYTLVNATPNEGGRAMGVQHAFGAFGIVCASALFPFILAFSPPLLGIIIAGLLLLSLIALALARRDRASVHEQRHHFQHHYVRRHVLTKVLGAVQKLNPASTLLALQNLAGALFYGAVWFVVPIVVAHEARAGVLSLGLGVFDLAIVLLGALLGKIADKQSKKKLIFIGLLLFAVAGILLGFNLNILFLLFGFVATTGDEMSRTSLWSWLETLDANHSQDGLVNGAITFFEDIGWTLGPALAGLLYAAVGPSLTIAFAATPIFLVWLFAFIVLRSQKTSVLVFANVTDRPLHRRHKG